ncbi:hypothetical protein CRE_18240 [Caenorhabditis remanei]|uniref:Uncharacterized protein n=1 Tax=Caenorhabditis remanei TaxID=31234 RepID=E3NFJ1_CAERE|nr:hypothetical protein CRE_18240 [Caenorhabditis remanei]
MKIESYTDQMAKKTEQEDESNTEQEDESNTEQEDESDTESEHGVKMNRNLKLKMTRNQITNRKILVMIPVNFTCIIFIFQILLVNALVSLGPAGLGTENIIGNCTCLICLKMDNQLKIKQPNHLPFLQNMFHGTSKNKSLLNSKITKPTTKAPPKPKTKTKPNPDKSVNALITNAPKTTKAQTTNKA